MKKNVLAVALALMASIGAYAEKNTISSPDGKLNVEVEDYDGKLYYSIDYAGKRMMEESQLGLLANVGDFSQGLTYQGKNEIKVEKSYDLRTAKVSHVDYHANQLNVTYINGKKQPMTVTFNVSNNDVAFRYTFDQLKAQHLIVNEEKTAFNLPKVTTTYLCPSRIRSSVLPEPNQVMKKIIRWISLLQPSRVMVMAILSLASSR